MKVIAMYLPQFHEVQENSEWWGAGFTEWTTVRKAEPLYPDHMQPKAPLNDYYYDLGKKETVEWQAQLMKEYGIHGLCFYHYWFKDGRRILEKPAENLLKWSDIPISFCFSWANEPWTRTWSKLNDKNSWADKFETDTEKAGNPNGVLLEQKYGNEKDWEEHFRYLLPFFKDTRYIRIDDRPVFIFHKPNSIPCLSRMTECWNLLARKEGLKDIYFIGTNIYSRGNLDALLYQEPWMTLAQYGSKELGTEKKGSVERVINYKEVWTRILHRPSISDAKIYYGGFTGHDDTPRRGDGGLVIEENTPELFNGYLKKLLLKNEYAGNEFVFINAWNEWGEGMYLEPDKKFGTRYLEAVHEALRDYRNDSLEQCIQEKTGLESSNGIVERYRSYWRMLNRWLMLKEEGIKLESYLIEQNIHNIAIYGLGMLGLHLVKELEGGEVRVMYGIDRRGNNIHLDFPVYRFDEPLLAVDAIIVTVTYAFESIYKILEKKITCPVISLEELLEESGDGM